MLTMDELKLIGDAPTTVAGREIRFQSRDIWIALHASITSDVYPDLPFFPVIGARDTEILAKAVYGALESGSFKKHFEDQAHLSGSGTQKEAAGAAQRNLLWVKRFAAFLEGCGGCRPA
jgi:hypothetical protein